MGFGNVTHTMGVLAGTSRNLAGANGHNHKNWKTAEMI